MITKQDIGWFKYWCRIHRLPFHEFGKGMYKNNPIKVRSRKK